MDSLLVSLTSQESNTSIHEDVSILNNVADTFINLDSDDLLLRHLGLELKNFNERFQDKLTSMRDTIESMKRKYPNDSELNDILSNLNSEIDQSRSESKLYDSPHGFVQISSKDLYDRIRISSQDMSPVILLWEQCLNKNNGKVKSALTEFVSTLEETGSKELSFHITDISSKLKNIDLTHSKKILQTLGQYSNDLREYDKDILKNAEISIALASYVIGDQHTYTSPLITNQIQKKHKQFLLSLS